MRGQLGLTVGLVLVVFLIAREMPAAEDASARMTVTGRVLDPKGQPVPNAQVLVFSQAKLRVSLDSLEELYPPIIGQGSAEGTGQFRIEGRRTSSAWAERLTLTALAPGYGINWVELDPDAEQPSNDITLRPERLIQGRLVDLQGQPAPGVEVFVYDMHSLPVDVVSLVFNTDHVYLRPQHVHDLMAWPQPVKSDAEGRFVLHCVGRGVTAEVMFHDPRYATETHLVRSDEALDPQGFTVSLQPPRMVSGRVTYADTGQPAAHARVSVNSFFGITETDGDGRFRLETPNDRRRQSQQRQTAGASPPAGEPYLAVSGEIKSAPGERNLSLDLSLPRGVPLRGKVTEEESGRPVAGASVEFIPSSSPDPGERSRPIVTGTGSDGSFQFGVVPRPGHLIVMAPSSEFVLREIGQQMSAGASRHRDYAHAYLSLDPKREQSGPGIHVKLRRGLTVAGQAVDPDGRPVQNASIISVGTSRFGVGGVRFEGSSQASFPGAVYRGRFQLFGLDPEAETPVHVLEPHRKLGAAIQLSGKSVASGPVTVRLEPCGKAQARLVDSNKKPVKASRLTLTATMVVTPGSPDYRIFQPREQGKLAADEVDLRHIDRTNYPYQPGYASDAEGRIAFPVLIPGATYRIYDNSTFAAGGPQFRKEFGVRAGESVDLGDILIEKPPK
jgi:protocatechuate 3,4-dioxygenase beta subunit